MSIGVISYSATQRCAAWFALFAILLIVVAPLISVSLQHDPMRAVPGMHHDTSMMAEHQMRDEPVTMPVEHGEACGYCVLLAHVPGLILALIFLLCGALRIQKKMPLHPAVTFWYYFPWLYPDTRAPPRRSAFSPF